MKFYVPTIGDKIYLEQPWTFNLFNEYRNESIAQRLGDQFPKVTRYNTYFFRKEKLKRTTSTAWDWTHIEFVSPDTECYQTDTEIVIENRLGYQIGELAQFVYTKEVPYETLDWSKNEITLPVGTCLAIDRIYIKKGIPDFDSITFYIESCPLAILHPGKGKKSGGFGGKGRARFWVKLKDANRIVCSLTPIYDKEAPAAKNRFENLIE